MKIEKYLDYELEDDETENGGISFVGETLADFLEELDEDEIKNLTLKDVNIMLKKCGIKEIKGE